MCRLSCLSILLLATPLVAADKSKWSVDDVLMAESVRDFQFAPNGKWVLWTKTVMNKEKGEVVTHLMRTDLSTHEDLELTRGDDSCTNPRWSPDGKLIAFLSERPAPKSEDSAKGRRAASRSAATTSRKPDKEKDEPTPQIWLINPFGGEAWRLTDCKRGVIAFNWARPDHLVFVAQEDKTWYDQKIKEDEDTSTVVEDEKHEPPARLFRIDVKEKKTRRLSDNTDQIDYVKVSPDGKWAVARHNRSLRYTYDSRVKPVILLHDLTMGTSKPIFSDKKFNISSAAWTFDSKGFYAINDFNSDPQFPFPAIQHVHFFDLASGQSRQVNLQWEHGLAAQDANDSKPGIVVTADGFVALLVNGVRHKLAKYTRNGDNWQRDWLEGEHIANVFGLDVSRDGKQIIFARTTASKPTEWRHATLGKTLIGDSTAIAKHNEGLNDKPKAKSEIIRWKGALDEEVEGILYYPHAYEKGKKYPLIVMIHGGPYAADLDLWSEGWAYAANLYCQRGALVFSPNYHGSSNYGLKWGESIAHGKYYDLEVPDIEKGVDHLIAKGLADKDKLGVIGWSNGSILTIALTVTTTRYKAASAGAGTIELVSDWANCDFGDVFDRIYLGKNPLEDPELYFRKSPFYKLDKVRTPTIIFFGTDDRTVPTHNGWSHYRGLQQLGKTDVRFVLFPGEKHSPKKLVHQRRKLQEELDWFDKHLFQKSKPDTEFVKDDSPLAHALKRHTAKQVKGNFGIAHADKLIPETVKYGKLQVGRFEVTRAQFQAFDPNYIFEKGTENLPASGISFERAQDYCAWLTKTTGATYRLPNENEADELYGEAEEGANTLDHWAGYKVNPDDARKLGEKIASLGMNSLLKQVGQFKAAGDEGVFDLGGNVAEWTTAKDGKGKLMGGSADQPADEKVDASKAAVEYRGFRVVRETNVQ